MPPRHKPSTPTSSNQQRPGPPPKYPSVGRQASTYDPNSNNQTSFTLPHNSAYFGDSSLDNLYHSDASPHNQGLAASPGVPSSHSRFPHSPSTLPPRPTETPPRNPQRSFDALLGAFQPNFDTWRRQDSKYVPTNSNPNPRKNPRGFLYDNGAGTGRLPKSELLGHRNTASTAPPSSESPPSSHLSNPFPPVDPSLVLPSQSVERYPVGSHRGGDSQEEEEEESQHEAQSGSPFRVQGRKELEDEARRRKLEQERQKRREAREKYKAREAEVRHLPQDVRKRLSRFSRLDIPAHPNEERRKFWIRKWEEEVREMEAYEEKLKNGVFTQNIEDLKSDIQYLRDLRD